MFITALQLTKASATAASSSDWRWMTELVPPKPKRCRSGLVSRLLPWLWATRCVCGAFDRMPSDEPGRCTAATSGGHCTRRLPADRWGDEDRLPAKHLQTHIIRTRLQQDYNSIIVLVWFNNTDTITAIIFKMENTDSVDNNSVNWNWVIHKLAEKCTYVALPKTGTDNTWI